MTPKLIGLIIFIITLTSCKNKVTAKFEITNKTGLNIDSLKIEPMVITDGKYISIKPNNKITYKADMTGITKTDGSYRLSYKLQGQLIIKDFGYYTNGYPAEKLIRIEIEKDTLKFDVKHGNY